MIHNFLLIFSFLTCIIACKSINKTNPLSLPTYTENGINMVVEIPAGTNHKIEINKETGLFEHDSLNGEIRVISFLPYVGNYGFIPSTYMDIERGGDGDALDILVLSESKVTGSVIEVKPIATLLLKDKGELDTKIIAIPIGETGKIIQVNDFQDFRINHWAEMNIIENWFLNYKGLGRMELLGWKDEVYAMKEIEKWAI